MRCNVAVLGFSAEGLIKLSSVETGLEFVLLLVRNAGVRDRRLDPALDLIVVLPAGVEGMRQQR